MSTIIRTRLLTIRPILFDYSLAYETNHLLWSSMHRNVTSCKAISLPIFCRNNSIWIRSTDPVKCNRTTPLSSVFSQHVCFSSITTSTRWYCIDKKPVSDKLQQTNNDQKSDPNIDDDIPPEKLGIVAKFKLMYKQYWYILVPVHLITSTGWLIGFYYLSKR